MFSSILSFVSMLLLFGQSNQLGCPLEQDTIWNITWPTSLVNQITITQKCPGGNDTEGIVTRTCLINNTWSAPDLSQCKTTKLTTSLDQVKDTLNNIVGSVECIDNVFNLLEQVTIEIISTINTTTILPSDISVIVDTLEAILNITRECKCNLFSILKLQVVELAKNIAMILNIVLNERHDDSFREVNETMQIAPRILGIIERVGILFICTFDIAQPLTQTASFSGSHIEFFVLLPSEEDVMSDSPFVFRSDKINQNNVSVPEIRILTTVVQQQSMLQGKRISIVNAFVINLETRLPNDVGQCTVSPILSTQLADADLEVTRVNLRNDTIELRINFTMSSLQPINPRCAFWNFTRDGNTGGFSDEGITTPDGINDNRILTCFSNHLTSFAVLVDATGQTGQGDNEPLSIVSYIGCVISIVCLTLSIILFLIFRKKIFNEIRHYIHINLSVALLLGLIVFVSGIETASDLTGVCLAVAILLHYFFLAAFSWMLCEAIVLLIAVKFVFYEGFLKSAKFYTPLGWGLPVPIVAISAAVSHEHYGTDERCWISEENGAIWAFIGPMLLIVLINTIVYIIVVHQVFRSKHNALSTEKADAVESAKASLKAAIILLPLVGVTWVFGLLAVNENKIVFAWIFAVLNTLQGLFIFFFHVIRNKKFRSLVKQHVTRNASSGKQSSSK